MTWYILVIMVTFCVLQLLLRAVRVSISRDLFITISLSALSALIHAVLGPLGLSPSWSSIAVGLVWRRLSAWSGSRLGCTTTCGAGHNMLPNSVVFLEPLDGHWFALWPRHKLLFLGTRWACHCRWFQLQLGNHWTELKVNLVIS